MQKLLDSAELIWVRVSYNEVQYFCVRVCYYPPKSRYSPIELVSVLHDNLEELLVVCPHDIFVITGDLSQLRYHSLLVDFGLSQIVTEPTTNSNILDVFLTSRPDLFDCRVAKSVLKSDHLAVYINCDQRRGGHPGAKRQIKCYNTSAANIARHNKFISDYNWNVIVSGIDNGTLSVNQAFADFVTTFLFSEGIIDYFVIGVLRLDVM